MADWGLIGGLGEGLKQGFASYQDAKKQQQEALHRKIQQDRQDKMFQLEAKSKGYEPDTLSPSMASSQDTESVRGYLSKEGLGGLLPEAPTSKDLEFARGKAYDIAREQDKMRSMERMMRQKQEARGPDLTPGQKAADVAFAREYQDYVAQGGSANLQKQLNTLTEVRDRLKSAKGSVGGASAYLPEGVQALTNPELVDIRDNITSAVMGSLRQILGPQFTEKEGQRIIQSSFNPKLSNEANAKRLDAEIRKLQQMAEAKNRAISQYEDSGSISGLRAQSPGLIGESQDQPYEESLPPGTRIQRNKKTGAVRYVDQDGNVIGSMAGR